MKKFISIASLVLINSCAFLISGKEQTIKLLPPDNSTEMKVEVPSSGSSAAVTLPATFNVQRSKNPLIINVKENSCYNSSQHLVNARINNVALLDILSVVWGISSTTTTYLDTSSGALWAYDDNIIVRGKEKNNCPKN